MTDLETTKLFYHHIAQKHKKYLPFKHITKPDCRTIIPEIELREELKILDIACGNGKLLFALAEIIKQFEFKGIDISEKMITRCKKRNKFPQIEFFISPADNLPFDDDYFDIITCTNAIRLFPQRVRAIDEMHRVLKKDGILYLMDGISSKKWKRRLDKILRQTKFIRPRKKYLPRSAIFSKSYLVIAKK